MGERSVSPAGQARAAFAAPGPAPPPAPATPPPPPPPPGLPLPLASLADLENDALRLTLARDLAKKLGHAHHSTCSFNADLRHNNSGLLVHVNEADFEGGASTSSGSADEASSTTDRLTDARVLLWNGAAQRVTPGVQHLVEFAKRLPAFNSLPQDDQLILIKLGFFEVFITRAHRAVSADYMLLDDGSIVTQSNLGLIYNPSFGAGIMHYMWTLWQLRLNDEELGALTGLLLVSPARPGLTAVAAVSELHGALGDALRVAATARVATLALAEVRIEAIVALAGEARLLGARHPGALHWCRTNWYRLTLPALFTEIFDIPKSDEEANETVAPTDPFASLYYDPLM